MPDTAPDPGLTNSRIVAAYRERTPGSARLAAEAREHFPSGITHDSRHLEPYTVYIERAAGPRKWDVDGNEYVDYFGGHGALILGHNHPRVTAAIQGALARGTHFGASHPLEVRWAELVKRLVPSAEKVRFTSSGTEATLMALRLARAYTGRSAVIRFKTHFHGWQDHVAGGQTSHFDGSATVGVLPGIAAEVRLIEANDPAALEAALAPGDVAAAIIEPTGSSTGMVPVRPAFLRELRDLTRRYGTLLVFDEVVTGFRVSPGGAQAHFGVLPDLTTLAKILAGGLPGGAVAGRREIFDRLDFEVTRDRGIEKIAHQGTYNANPVSAAAGVAALEVIAEGGVCERANGTADEIRRRLNEVFVAEDVPWVAYGTFSAFHIFTDPRGRRLAPEAFDPFALPYDELKSNPPGLAHRLRLAMLLNGVDINGWPGGTVSATHGPAEVDRTVDAFRRSVRMLRDDGML